MDKKEEKSLVEGSWQTTARDLAAIEGPVFAFVRHAHRAYRSESGHRELVPEGVAAARMFGMVQRQAGIDAFMHTDIKRTRDTAAAMEKGFSESDGGKPYTESREAHLFKVDSGEAFHELLHSGPLFGSMELMYFGDGKGACRPGTTAAGCARFLSLFVIPALADKKRTVCVSHDLSIMCMSIHLGCPVSLVPFMTGLLFRPAASGFSVTLSGVVR